MTSRSSYTLFGLLCTASVLGWSGALRATIALALHNDAYTHILLIAPVSVLLLVLDWRRKDWKPAPNRVLGSLLLVAAALIGIGALEWGHSANLPLDVRLTLEMSALVVWWIGAFLFCFGLSIFRECSFPLLFLFCMVPMPDFMLNWVVDFLQRSTVWCARAMLVIAGVPVTQNGTILTIPGLSVEVAEECSSIRSSMMLIVSSVVMSYLLLRTFWSRTIVVVAAIPLSIAKNGLRVFVLAVLAAYVNQGILKGPLHHQGGVVFFAIGLAGLLTMIWIMSKFERPKTDPRLAAQLHCLTIVGNK